VADVTAEKDGMRRRFNCLSIYCTGTFSPSGGGKGRNLSSGECPTGFILALRKPPTITLNKSYMMVGGLEN
jgi:hypothetical protein